MQRTTDDWKLILRKLGAEDAEVERWAPVCAAVIGDDTFSMGDEELDDFLGQVFVESQGLTRLEENLRYKTAERICQVFRSRVRTLAEAHPLVRNPRALAEKVYGRRADLGNMTAEDGWLCRGSGLIQVTGLKNLTHLAEAMGWSDPYALAEAMRTDPEVALRASIAWWEGNVRDAFVNQPRKVRVAVNGPAALGLEETTHAAERAATAIAETAA